MAFKIESNLLDACALAILDRGDTYGYEITQEMKSAIDISESTLYPVLRRLQKDNLCFNRSFFNLKNRLIHQKKCIRKSL